jgi:hypothetical protein
MIACSGAEEEPSNFNIKKTSGSLTITGIPDEYKGLWIKASANFLYACADIKSAGKIPVFYAAKIPQSGEVTLKVWESSSHKEFTEYKNYNKSETVSVLKITIVKKEVYHYIEESDNIISKKPENVTFTNGTATVSWPTE